MNLLEWILNLAGVCLWIDWRAGRANRGKLTAISLATTVREVRRSRGTGWGSLGLLFIILILRPFIFTSVGPAVEWTPRLDLLAVSLPWRSDLLDLMFIYSTLSFAMALGFFYSWLLLLHAANPDGLDSPDADVSRQSAIQRFVRVQLGFLAKLPWLLKLILPSLVVTLCWTALKPLFTYIGIMPDANNPAKIWGQAAALGLAALLVWKWLLVLLFGVHFVNLYVYLGSHPLWSYISTTARRLLKPLSFLRFGKLDLSPVAAIIIVILAADFLLRPAATNLFERFIS